MSETTLTFEHGKFVLSVGTIILAEKLRRDPYWTFIGEKKFSTNHAGKASAFRRVATERVEEILKRTFQEHYELPLLPRLSQPDPHQWEGIKWILTRKRSYLAHAPGAGKTAEAILSACFAQCAGQTIFVVPPSLVKNWEREILKVTEWLNLWPSVGFVARSDKKENVAWRADFLIIPDSMLTKDWVYEKLRSLKIKLLAVDEASRFKEPLSERSLAFYGGKSGDKIYSGLFQSARHVVFLDGSPMPNRPMELWAPAFALHPESIDCMSYDDFGYRYCGPRVNPRGQWEYKWSSHESELKAKIQKDFMHVVSEDKLSHPERLRTMVFLNEDVRSRDQKEWQRKNLNEIVNEDSSQGELATFRRELGTAKVPLITEYVREKLEKGESILLFCWHREVIALLSNKLHTYYPGILMGGTSLRAREDHIKHFQSGKTKLLILNIQAGGRGFNLQRADRVIFGEFSWTDENNKQCEKRASRKGSTKKNVKCDYLVVPNSMDEIVLRSVFTKEKRIKKVIGG